jgi:hypothetical protein
MAASSSTALDAAAEREGLAEIKSEPGTQPSDKGCLYRIRASNYKPYNLGLHLFSLGLYIFDVGSDTYLATKYFLKEEYLNAGLTLAFVTLPSIMISIFFTVITRDDYKAMREVEGWKWIFRVLAVILQIGPIIG